MIIWGLRIIGWIAGSPWTAAIAAAVLATAIGWHTLDRRAARLAQIEQAVQTERLKWHEEMQKEARRQAEVGRAALDAAKADVARLEAENTALAANQREWDREADAESGASDRCLSDGSILRLNRNR